MLASLPIFFESAFTFLLTALTWVGAALAVMLLFGFTIFIHEFGHFIAARLCGLKVDTFSLGFGPAIWQRRIGEIDYKICWIPLGGYVALPQLDPSGMQTIQGDDGSPLRDLPPAIWWKRILVSICGPLGNVVLAIVLALVVWALPPKVADNMVFDGAVIGSVEKDSKAEAGGLRAGDKVISVNGNKIDSWGGFMTECHLGASGATVSVAVSNILDGVVATLDAPVEKSDLGYFVVKGIQEAHFCAVGEIVKGSPAERAGLQLGDVVVSLNGKGIVGVSHAVDILHASGGASQTLGYERNGRREFVDVVPEKLPEGKGEFVIGVTLYKYSVSVPMWMKHRNPVDQIKGDVSSVTRVLSALFAPKQKGETARVGKALSGPIMIVTSLWMTVMSGLIGTLSFVRFLNMNLAMLNLLPIPVLDGGHIVFALWRGVFRREIPAKVVNALVNVFAVLLISMFVLVSLRDVWSMSVIFGGHRGDAEQEQAPEPDPASTNAPALSE